jgi:enoyl-CoA hydratase
MAEPVLLVDRRDGIATFTLNRPSAMNALSRALREALRDAFTAVAGEADVGVVVLTGAGRAFCAGLDLKELGGETDTPEERSARAERVDDRSARAERVDDRSARAERVDDRSARAERVDAGGAVTSGADVITAMARCPQPIIGAINGFAITGGFELALACDLLIASSAARFADTHARVGIMPGWGLSQKLSRLIGIGRAKELSLTGNFLDAEQAAAWGLVNRVVPPGELLASAQALARDMLSCDPDVLRAYKRVIDEGYAMTFGDGLRLERERNAAHSRSVTPAQIAERRAAVQARGRSQKGD